MAEPALPSPIEAPPPSYDFAQLNLDQKLAIATERSLSIPEQRQERERGDGTEEQRDKGKEEVRHADESRSSERSATSVQIDGQQRSGVRPLSFRKKSRGGSKDDSCLSVKDKERPSWFEEAQLGTSASNSSASERASPSPRGPRPRQQNRRPSLHILHEDSDEDRSLPPPPFADVDNSLDGPVYERYASNDTRRRRTGGTIVLRYTGEGCATPPPSQGAQLRHNSAASQENSRLHHAPQQSRLDVPTVMPRPRSADPHILPTPPPRLSFNPYVAYEGTSAYGQSLADSEDQTCDVTSLYRWAGILSSDLSGH